MYIVLISVRTPVVLSGLAGGNNHTVRVKKPLQYFDFGIQTVWQCAKSVYWSQKKGKHFKVQ